MHRDRNNGSWPELKAKRHNKFENPPLEKLEVMHDHLESEAHDNQKVKKDRAAKQLARLQNMFKDMADYTDEND